MMKIKSKTQPIVNAEVFDIYSNDKKIAVRLVAADGFELVREGDEPNNISAVDIPAQYSERLSLYKTIPKKETGEEL